MRRTAVIMITTALAVVLFGALAFANATLPRDQDVLDSDATMLTVEDVVTERTGFRLAGPTRIETAIEISKHHFPDGAEVVYLARQDDFPDALAGGVANDGPILLVRTNVLPDAVAHEIGRLDPRTVIALGGPAAVSQSVLEAAIAAR